MTQLRRELGPITATAVVAGTIIGTGVFLKPAAIAQAAGSEFWVLMAWVVAGLLSLAGALTYAELGALMPEAGGEYVYLREAYGKRSAFLYGWMRFFIGAAGSIAAYAVGSTEFIAAIVDLGPLKAFLPSLFILYFTLTNSFALRFGAKVAAVISYFKVAAIAGLFVLIFTMPAAPASDLAEPGFQGVASFSAAILAALWAFDGWNNLVMMGGEIRNPTRNLPRALVFGMLLVLGLYLLAHWAYFHALDFHQVASAHSTLHPDAPPVATLALTQANTHATSGESWAVLVVSALFVVSALGALNNGILTSARVPYALAKDGLFLPILKKLSPKGVPVLALIAQAIVSILLATTQSFDQLTDAVVFASWVFYAACTGAVFIMRRRLKEEGRALPYRMPLYPFLPLAFLGVTFWLLVTTVIEQPTLTVIGLGLVALGLPFYELSQRRQNQRDP